MRVSVFFNFTLNGGIDPLLHLHCRFIGEGNHHQAVDRELFLPEDFDNPTGQHLGLSGAGTGRNYQIARCIRCKMLKQGGREFMHYLFLRSGLYTSSPLTRVYNLSSLSWSLRQILVNWQFGQVWSLTEQRGGLNRPF